MVQRSMPFGRALDVPDAAVPYIAMHRTHLRGELKKMYAEDVVRDFESLRPYLPSTAISTLDIGCGMAGIDVLLWHYYDNPTIHLLDGTGYTEVRVLFHPVMSPYNSMPIARRLLELNGVPSASIVEWPAEPAAAVPQCDLIVSLLSWGFHYPISTYLSLVERSLRPSGRLILDVRKGTDGMDALMARLKKVATVATNVKADRACFEKAAAGEAVTR